MTDDFGSGDSGLGAGGGLPYGMDNASAHLRTADAQRPVPHENPGARYAAWLPKLAGATILIVVIAWAIRVFLLA